MKDFPSCFGESGVQVADSSSAPSKSGQNLVTCVYQCRLRRLPCFITVTWSRNLMGQGLGVTIENSFSQCLCRVDIKPWLFSKRKGLKTIEAAVDSDRIDIYWDVSSAKFGSGPEPVEGFYLAVGFNREIVLLLGDMRKEVCRKFDGDRGLILRSNEAVFVAKKEHVFGKKFYCVKAQFIGDGELHDVGIECDTSVDVKEHCLVMKVDGKVVMQVKRLKWKFRGNGTILVDGLPVEVYWDVHDWLFGGGMGNAVFMFQTCLSAEKLWNSSSQPVFDLSCSSSRFKECQSQGLGFSLVLYAWKND
ncbi:hypothetical protein LINPERPRIM_LOCUS14086 [Linum perenne]